MIGHDLLFLMVLARNSEGADSFPLLVTLPLSMHVSTMSLQTILED